MKSISEMIDAGEPIAYASSKEWRSNQLMSAAQHKSALSKNVVDFDIPLYAHPSAALSVPAAAVVGEPENEAADTAGRKLSLWFFRDLSGEQRGKLFGLFGMNDALKDTNHGYQAMALKQVLRALGGAK